MVHRSRRQEHVHVQIWNHHSTNNQQYQRSASESTIIASIEPPLASAGPFKPLVDSSPDFGRASWTSLSNSALFARYNEIACLCLSPPEERRQVRTRYSVTSVFEGSFLDARLSSSQRRISDRSFAARLRRAGLWSRFALYTATHLDRIIIFYSIYTKATVTLTARDVRSVGTGRQRWRGHERQGDLGFACPSRRYKKPWESGYQVQNEPFPRDVRLDINTTDGK